MVIVSIDEVKVGDVIASPVKIDGIDIVQSGITVSPLLLNALKNLGVKSVWIASLDIEYKKLSKINLKKTKMYNNIAKFAMSYSHSIDCYNDVVKEFDHSLFNHSVNTSMITSMILSDIVLPLPRRRNIITGAILHDIGKLKVDSAILNKPGKLTKEEYESIKMHPLYGIEVGADLKLHDTVMNVIVQHHENYDGSGYPYGLSKGDIAMGAMAVHIADVYEAMCSKRVYKQANARKEVKEEMRLQVGTLFDPILFKHFDKNVPLYFKGEVVSVDGIKYIVIGYSSDGNPVFQCNETGDIFNHDELISKASEVFITDSIHVDIM